MVTTYTYDTQHRLTGITYDTSAAPGVAATNNVAYTYDNTAGSATYGLLLSVSDSGPLAAYTETYQYDSYQRVAARTWSRDGRSYTTSYQYNSANQVTQLTYPVTGRTLNYSHDQAGRLATLADQYRMYLSSVGYTAAGQVTRRTYGNGVAESFGYSPTRLQLTAQTAAVGGQTRLNLTYGYQAAAGQMGGGTTAGNAGQVVSVSGQIGGAAESAAYTYDNLGRLVTSSQTTNGASVQRRFAYDRWGNRTGVWDAVSGGSQIQSVALQSFLRSDPSP